LDDVLGMPADQFIVAECAADGLTGVSPVRPAIGGIDGPFYLVVGTLAHRKNLPGSVTAVIDSGRNIVVVGASGNQQVFSEASSLARAPPPISRHLGMSPDATALSVSTMVPAGSANALILLLFPI
jgi:hypothetical protein